MNRQQRTVAQKMGIKIGSRAYLQGAPIEALQTMNLPELDRTKKLDGKYDYIHLFTKSQSNMAKDFSSLRNHLKTEGSLWVS